MEGFAERVEALRRHRGWTKAELARRTGLHTQHLYKILSGERSRIERKRSSPWRERSASARINC